MYKEDFTERQIMDEHFYEYHHYRDTVVPLVDFHEHAFYEVYMFISGSVNYVIEGRTYRLAPGDILITNSSDIHRPEITQTDGLYERIVIWLDDDFFSHIRAAGEDMTACFKDAASRNYRLVRPGRAQQAELAGLCRIVEREKESSLIGSAALAYSAVMSIIVLISRAYYGMPDMAGPEVSENSQVNKIITYINEHLSENLTIDGIAARFYISSSHLSHQFKKYTGLSVYSYITKKRLNRSRSILSQGTPVMTACIDCGFSDYSNFLKAFRREFGCSPSFFTQKKNITRFDLSQIS